MTTIARRWAPLMGAALVFLLASSGCGRLEVVSSPDTFPISDTTASDLVSGGQDVALRNFYQRPAVVSISESRSGFDADLHQYTQTAVTLLERALDKRGISVASTGRKSVTLKVSDVTLNDGWTFGCRLNLMADLGDGDKVMVPAQNNSPATAYRAVDGALMHAVTNLLLDREFQKYINQ